MLKEHIMDLESRLAKNLRDETTMLTGRKGQGIVMDEPYTQAKKRKSVVDSDELRNLKAVEVDLTATLNDSVRNHIATQEKYREVCRVKDELRDELDASKAEVGKLTSAYQQKSMQLMKAKRLSKYSLALKAAAEAEAHYLFDEAIGELSRTKVWKLVSNKEPAANAGL